jgi:hypothetical protein
MSEDDIFVSAITGATDAYRQGAGLPPLEKVCPWCKCKHSGPFRACSKCKASIDSGERESFSGYIETIYSRRD